MKKSNFEEVSFFLDTGTYSKWPFTNYCYVDVTSLPCHIPAGQCSGTPSTRNSCFTLSRDTGFHTTMVMATEQPWSESGGLSCVERTGAASVSHTHSWHQSPQDTSGWRVADY